MQTTAQATKSDNANGRTSNEAIVKYFKERTIRNE